MLLALGAMMCWSREDGGGCYAAVSRVELIQKSVAFPIITTTSLCMNLVCQATNHICLTRFSTIHSRATHVLIDL